MPRLSQLFARKTNLVPKRLTRVESATVGKFSTKASVLVLKVSESLKFFIQLTLLLDVIKNIPQQHSLRRMCVGAAADATARTVGILKINLCCLFKQ